ncbi:hypothetical protein RP20_CCG026353 [Aedes albopictus]|nr:hypothetical protein RP20_CCG026353 [Aedes albopictus]
MRNIEELQSCAVFARDRINPYLFNYALSVALLHRRDTKNLDLPSVVEVFPDKYVDSRVFEQIREEATVVPEGMRMPIVIPKDFTASDLDEEHRLWYFREDIGVNLHHWHWHLVYPFEASNRAIVDKDRRGELFYYMHSQLIARYNFERFCNRLQRCKRLNNLREPIAEGYFPKLDSLVASRTWPGRVDNAVIKDLNRELDQIKQDVSDLERWIDRIYEAVHQGYVVDESGNRIFLDEEKGIDILGNIIESSILSPNRQLYGDMHNVGHVFLSYTHDPDHRHLESFGVMGDVATAMRDPVFYRWHSFIDDIFQEHKIKLPAYTKSQLTYEGISVTGIIVQSEGAPVNTMHTYWQQSDVDLSRGMDFVPRGNVFARISLVHEIHFRSSPRSSTAIMNDTSLRLLSVYSRKILKKFLGKFHKHIPEKLLVEFPRKSWKNSRRILGRIFEEIAEELSKNSFRNSRGYFMEISEKLLEEFRVTARGIPEELLEKFSKINRKTSGITAVDPQELF